MCSGLPGMRIQGLQMPHRRCGARRDAVDDHECSTPEAGWARLNPLHAAQLAAELRCHSNLLCSDCYVADVGWHEAVCLTPDELRMLQALVAALAMRP